MTSSSFWKANGAEPSLMLHEHFEIKAGKDKETPFFVEK
jgi:hypothetical protein